ncbi:MAG: hypothetical protein C4321_08920 [Chloroflexota bacterium]
MLSLIGGATRPGKTTLTQRLFRERRTPYFVLDYFVSALTYGAPELGVHHDQPDIERATRLWPRLRPMLENILEVEPAYVIEGDTLLPGNVADLMAAYPGEIRICFLGYPEIAPEEKFRNIRERGGGVNDWLRDASDAYVHELVGTGIAFSRHLQAECARHALPFFDTSQDFAAGVEAAYAWLTRSD